MAVEIDAAAFHRRASALISAWQSSSDETIRDLDALLITVGAADEQNLYAKNACTQVWLLGYEFTDTVFAITRDKTFYVVTSQKKATYLESLENSGQTKVVLLRRTKNEADNAQLNSQLVEKLAASGRGKQLGTFVKDKPQSKFMTEWSAAIENPEKGFSQVDMTPLVSQCMAVKEEGELRTVEIASKMSSAIMRNYFMDEMSALIDDEKTITHEQFTNKLENLIAEDALQGTAQKLRFPPNADLSLVEYCYQPIVQSGGVYDLKPTALSNDDSLHAGTILCSLGIRYKSYCSNVSRTFMINPSKEQEKNYEFLLATYGYALSILRAGTRAKDIYTKVLGYVKTNRPDLESSFVKNIGFGMGIEFRDSQYLLNAKNERDIPAGSIFNLTMGFQSLTKQSDDVRNKTYALLLSDTVRIDAERATVLSSDSSKDANDVCFYFEEEADEPVQAKKEVKKEPARPSNNVTIVKSKTRAKEQVDQSSELARRSHQKELARLRHEEGLARFSNEDGSSKQDNRPVFRKFESYKKDVNLPREMSANKIYVDARSSTIILPIYGLPVPFHISTLRNLTKSDEGEFIFLRLNFITPGQTVGKKDETPFEDPNATFVRMLTYRSSDVGRMNEVYRQITDLKKSSQKAEAERKDKADIVEQDRLIEIKKTRPITLQDVFARPTLDGKRLPGDLQIHENGIRYVSRLKSDNKIDILFSNIQHLIFQPCDNELIVILHVHLKHPIMIGKKKAKDVQFYREATELQFDETGNRKRRAMYGDEDELQQEQEEKRKRARLNREFKDFGEKIVQMDDGRLTLDIPFRDLGFTGVAFRSNVLLQPTTDCLVHLSDSPFLIITVSEVEVAHLERIQFGLKNFDLVFVFKDFSRQPIQIGTIPMQQLDAVKDWLDQMDVSYTEGPVNLNWNAIMKTINDDPAAFFEEGGWSFLQPGSDAEGQSDSEESASEFEAESDASGGSSSGSSDYSVASEEDSGSGSSEDDDESGEDWDEMEEKARRSDEKRKRDLEDDDRSHKKRR
ncbi:FACT complex subunit spt16 [Sorochytrium milnesiophthora]